MSGTFLAHGTQRPHSESCGYVCCRVSTPSTATDCFFGAGRLRSVASGRRTHRPIRERNLDPRMGLRPRKHAATLSGSRPRFFLPISALNESPTAVTTPGGRDRLPRHPRSRLVLVTHGSSSCPWRAKQVQATGKHTVAVTVRPRPGSNEWPCDLDASERRERLNLPMNVRPTHNRSANYRQWGLPHRAGDDSALRHDR